MFFSDFKIKFLIDFMKLFLGYVCMLVKFNMFEIVFYVSLS